MQEQPIGSVDVPSINLPYYVSSTIDFFVSHWPAILGGLKVFIGWIIGLSVPVSVLLFIGIVYSLEKLRAIRRREEDIYNAKVDMGYDETREGDTKLAKRWDNVLALLESANHSDWRHAILEADIILGELLTHMGYRGDSIGEQLKRVDKADFKSLDLAWEAHKVRNNIAHEGSDLILNQHEAKRVINLYKQVFEEFYYV